MRDLRSTSMLIPRARARRPYALFILGLALFAVWTMAVLTPAVRRSDWTVALSLQPFASPSLDMLTSFITITGNVEVSAVLVLFIGAVLARAGQVRPAIVLSAVFAGGSILELIGKHWFVHPGVPLWLHRPSLNLWHRGWQQLARASYGYPSGHAFRTLLLAAVGRRTWSPRGYSRRLVRYGLVAVVLLMGLALVYLGDHWASEVVGGYLLGIMGVGLLPGRAPTASPSDDSTTEAGLSGTAGWAMRATGSMSKDR